MTTTAIYLMAAHPDGIIVGMKIDPGPKATPEQFEKAAHAQIPCPMGCEHGMTRVPERDYKRWKEADPDTSITCPRCFMTSYAPGDITNGYCGNCKAFTSNPME